MSESLIGIYIRPIEVAVLIEEHVNHIFSFRFKFIGNFMNECFGDFAFLSFSNHDSKEEYVFVFLAF